MTAVVRGRSALCILVAIAVWSASLGVAGAASSAPGQVSGSGTAPLTFDDAKAQGINVDWGPKCDTTTGKVAVPSGYAPPCVKPWTGGDNGGATAHGVTKDTIIVALYQAQPDLLQQAYFQSSGSDESLAKERDTTQAYVDYFTTHYETYGRKV